jgi:hypothetical protein
VGGHHVNALGHLETGGVGIHDERADAPGPRGLARAGKQHVKVGNAAVGDPGFFAIQHPTLAQCITHALRAAGHGRHVGARLRLGQRKRGNGLATGHARQVALALRY